MDANEFNAWLSRNVGSGGKRPKSDAFNKGMKGHERNPSAPEYPCKDIPEYNHYSERENWRKEKEEEEKRNQDENRNQDQKNNSQNATKNVSSSGAGNAGQIAQSIIRNIVPKVALVVGGTVVVVGGYNEIKAKEARAVVASATWVWSEDNSSATINFWNDAGNLVKESPATITSEGTPATCTEKGYITYTATAENEGKTYTDSRSFELDPLGHAFDEGTKTIIDGKPSTIFTCTRCGEEFIVTISPEEIEADTHKYTATWFWSEDHMSCEVELSEENGGFVKRLPAEVTSALAKEATCREEGDFVYRATVEDGWYTYTDTYVEHLPALGHSYGEPQQTVIGDQVIWTAECERCHEVTLINITIEEDEGEQGSDSAKPLYHVASERYLHVHEDDHHCDHHHLS